MNEIYKEINLLKWQINEIKAEQARTNPMHRNFKLLEKVKKTKFRRLDELKIICMKLNKIKAKRTFEKNTPKLFNKMADYMNLHSI